MWIQMEPCSWAQDGEMWGQGQETGGFCRSLGLAVLPQSLGGPRSLDPSLISEPQGRSLICSAWHPSTVEPEANTLL